MMKIFNLIVVFSPDQRQVLMCHRTSNPYLGLYNFVGGKVEPNETIEQSAYRELFEETGISKEDLALTHILDYTYPIDEVVMNVYYGVLNKEVTLVAEKHPLVWFDVNTNFMEDRFAGDGNTFHMVKCAQYYLQRLR